MSNIHPDWSYVAGAAAAPNPIALSHLATLQVVPQWTEAIAIVEELCATITERGAPLLVPELQDVSITAQGTVMIRKGASGSTQIDELGHILHALLDSATTPAPVRLFVAHAIDSGAYSSVEEFAQALAYYGRPNRQELIRALYERVLLAPEPVDSAPPEPHGHERSEPTARKRVAVAWLAAAAGLAGFVFVGVWAWNAVDASSDFSRLQARIAAATDGARVRLGLTRSDAPPAEAEAVPVEGAAPQGGTSKRSTPPAAPVRRSPSADRVADAVAAAPPVLSLPSTPTVDGALATPPVIATQPPVHVTADPETTVYSTSDTHVEPPVLLAPKLPPVPLAQTFAAGTNTMELLVDEHGLVEQVRLVSTPVRLADMTLLSAAKTWRFHPALKDGHPVKYRLPLSWTVSPP